MRLIFPRNPTLLTVGFALVAALLAMGALSVRAQAATEGHPVPTETIIVPPNKSIEPGTPDVPPDSSDQPMPGPVLSPGMPLPEIGYDPSKLPVPVARLRQQIIDAAATGDPEKLRPIIEADSEPPQLSFDDVSDPIAFLKSSSGDEGGREILAILTEVLEAGYVHVGVGTKDDMYVWPYFAYYPVDKLTPRQMVELFKLVYAGDYEDMKNYGGYLYYRVGIAPDGRWRFFISGE